MSLCWSTEGPIDTSRHWCIPLETLHLGELAKVIEQGRCAIIHGHPTSGKTTHCNALAMAIGQEYVVFRCTLLRSGLSSIWDHIGTQFGFSGCEHSDHFLSFLALRTGKPAVLLFDDCQLLNSLDDNTLDYFFSTIKTLRDNREKYNFQAFVAFGTYSTISALSRSSINISTQILLLPPKEEKVCSLFQRYHQIHPQFSASVMKDIANISGGHIGLVGICGVVLEEMLKSSSRQIELKQWIIEGHPKILQLMQSQKHFQDMTQQIKTLNLVPYLKEKNLLYFEKHQEYQDFWMVVNMHPNLKALFDIGALRPSSDFNAYSWTSPFIHQFVINLCNDSVVSIPPELSPSSQLDVLLVIKAAIKNIDMRSIPQPNQNPPKALLQAELYGLIIQTLKPFPSSQPFIEGYLTSGSIFDYVLLIHNEINWAIELKVNCNAIHSKEKAVGQIKQYANLWNASRAIVVNFTDGGVEEILNKGLELADLGLDVDTEVEVLFIDVVCRKGSLEKIIETSFQ